MNNMWPAFFIKFPFVLHLVADKKIQEEVQLKL